MLKKPVSDRKVPTRYISIHGKKYDMAKVPAAQLDAWRAECLKALPATKKYQVVYADPPWKYEDMGNVDGRVSYPSMTQDDLKKMPVQAACAPTCVLFMWATSPKLPEALDLIRAWGFEYKTVFKVWLKRTAAGEPVTGCGWWSRPSTELVLVATRGGGYMKWKTTCSEKQEHEAVRSNVHSEKPECIRQAVRAFLDVPRRLELFARTTADGFDAWGLEIPGFFHKCAVLQP